MAGTVAIMEDLGSDTFVYASVEDPGVAGVDGAPVTLVARCPRRTAARIGDGVRLAQVEPAVHLFHPDTGDRIN